MALFSYQAISKAGKKVSGTLDAPSQGSARELLQKQGFFPIEVIPAHKAVGAEGFWQSFVDGSVSLQLKIAFTKQLAVLLRSGIPLLQALELLADQFEGRMHRIIVTIKDGLKEGQSLADGLKQYPRIFENIYVQLVRSGEASGKLEVILDRLTQYLERREELNQKVSSALRGPLLNLGMIFLITIGLVGFVVPKLASVFESQGASLPASTKLLMSLSDLLINHYLILIVSISLLIVSFFYWKSTASGSLMVDRIKLKIPIVSTFARVGAIVQFCRTLGMLLEGGVNLPEALDIVVSIVDNQVLKQTLKEAREKIIKQGQMAQYLKQTGIFPPMATYLINTGEQTGRLDAMLLVVGENYEKELNDYSDSLSALISPFMSILMAVVVGFIVLSIMQPMSNLTQMI